MSIGEDIVRPEYALDARRLSGKSRSHISKKTGWSQLQNGFLLKAAENAGFDVFLTADQSIRYQQNLSNRRIALVLLTSTNWPAVEPHVGTIVRAVDAARPGTY